MADTFNITPYDFKVRVSKIACCLAAKGYSLANKLKIGMPCKEDLNKHLYAVAMFKLLKCYETSTETTLDEVNCVTTDEVDAEFKWFEDYCDLCFSPDYEYYDSQNQEEV